MKKTLPLRSRTRYSFARLSDVMDIPNLIETQQNSYAEFLQKNISTEKRKEIGLHAAFHSIFPIEATAANGDKTTLDYTSYTIGDPKYNIEECMDRGMTFAAPVKVKFQLIVRKMDKATGTQYIKDIKEQELYLGELPIMTPTGTFVINGAERVIVSQMHRSPGVTYGEEMHPSGRPLLSARLIPTRGAWVEMEIDHADYIYVSIDRRRKFYITTLLRAFGFDDDEELLAKLYPIRELRTDTASSLIDLEPPRVAADVVDMETGEVIAEPPHKVTDEVLNRIRELGIKKIKILDVDFSKHSSCFIKTLEKDPYKTKNDALVELYRRIRPGNPPTPKSGALLLETMFTNAKRYDLGKVGRFRLNKKLGIERDLEDRILHKEDLIIILKYLLKLCDGEGFIDDIDHLGNRRIRSVGELLENQIRMGLAAMERGIRERLSILDLDTAMPHNLINAKPVFAAIRDFFGRSQLSQFMDQTNPLAELTHKRRLSALGPGGLNRERAGFEVRDVHYTHYGRVCPIETPEGPNIGLISSLATYARINEYGFLETPYRKVVKGKVIAQIVYLSADEEDKHTIAQANEPLTPRGNFVNATVSSRAKGEFPRVPKEAVDYMDISPKQLVSVSAALIPFLEHDDANRALMGSNMQRQAVPLLHPEAPLIGTGIEHKVALDSGSTITAKADGIVTYVSSDLIIIAEEDETSRSAFLPSKHEFYRLRKYQRSNQNTCINQRPVVQPGDRVKQGQIIADGPATSYGELALGRNVLAAYMPWYGYNFEDAIIISERLVKDDIFSSVHIEEFELEARDTKLGKEEITRDIPNLGEETLRDLDETGIIRIGAEVRSNDILVGKVTPKGETELSSEEKLLRAIFGEKARDVLDASLRLPPGNEGIVIDTKIFSRRDRMTVAEKNEEARLNEEAKKAHDLAVRRIRAETKERIRQLFTQKIKSAVYLLDSRLRGNDHKAGPGKPSSLRKRGAFYKPGDEINAEFVDTLQEKSHQGILKFTPTVMKALQENWVYEQKQIHEANDQLQKKLEQIRNGDELPPGVAKLVKVYVAKKRKLKVGDKLAGRHGNKGVVSRLVPEEDLPHLKDGTPVDIILNPLGVPSRMNVGQILELHLGWAASRKHDPHCSMKGKTMKTGAASSKTGAASSAPTAGRCAECNGLHIESPVFDGAKEKEAPAFAGVSFPRRREQKHTSIKDWLKETALPESGKTILYDGLTGEPFEGEIAVGYTYIMKLAHLVDDKIHARSIGPYSLVTQQPLGGKAQFGGQRFGEMEVWAMEAYGAAYTLQELLTVKSDDVQGRTKVYEAMVKGENAAVPGIPESFNVLVKELQGLGLQIDVLSQKRGEPVAETPGKEE
ncbi:MAG: DNA-directed RNA polymerase subunit beta [bacterium]|nr:DNA-directed RNA polymerase subunit beta [bacterium]